MSIVNEIKVDFLSIPENEGFARLTISAFLLPLNPTMSELSDVKTAVSEAVTNAIIHGYQGKLGTVRMRATLTDKRFLTVDITDNGVGIPEEDIPHLFERFYRVEKARSSDKGGTGLGLAIAKEFAAAHGGDIRVSSIVGKGTTFTVTLPKHGKL